MRSRSDAKVHKKIMKLLINMPNMMLNFVTIGIMLENRFVMSQL
jgi:hypothetical protein